MRKLRLLSVACLLLMSLSGCLSPFVLEQAVTAYDHAVTDVPRSGTPSITIAK